MKALASKPPAKESLDQRNSHLRQRPIPEAARVLPLLHSPAIVQRIPACACGGGCPNCQSRLPIQAKLKIGAPDDKYEQEADRIADDVMRMPEPKVQSKSACSKCDEEEESQIQTKPIADQITPLIQRQVEPEEEEEELLQTKGTAKGVLAASFELESRIHSLKGSGQPLLPFTRALFEPRFGYDFSGVQIHTDSSAAGYADSIDAKAFTYGNHIAFNRGQYAADTFSGRKLLAHELTHVVQQTGGRPRATGGGVPNDSKTTWARTAVDRYVSGEPTTIQRLPEDCPSSREIEPEHPGTCPEITRDPGERKRFRALGSSVRMVLPFKCYVLENLPINGTAFGAPALLTEIADFLLLNPGTTLHLTGFTDCLGSASTNDRLRNERAFAVEQYLTTVLGVAPAMIFIENEPETAYLATNDSAFDRAQNRTVAIYLDSGRPAPRPPSEPEAPPAPQRICGPDITASLTTVLGTVGPWFRGLSTFRKHRSCVALGPAAPLVGVNPIMAWDTRELYLPNTGWLDAYFRSRSCGSPRDAGCDTDPTRNLCETAGSCGNSVVVGGKCMLAGTANYALFGTMCRLCHDETSQWGRWDMRAIIGAYKTISGDDSTPPKEVASAAYDRTFPTLPAAAENRRTCTGRCGVTHGGAFDFIWEPYKPR